MINNELEESEEFKKLRDEIVPNIFRFCNTCLKQIDKNEPYIVAYKNGFPAYFCRKHIHDAEYYLDWFQEIIEIK